MKNPQNQLPAQPSFFTMDVSRGAARGNRVSIQPDFCAGLARPVPGVGKSGKTHRCLLFVEARCTGLAAPPTVSRAPPMPSRCAWKHFICSPRTSSRPIPTSSAAFNRACNIMATPLASLSSSATALDACSSITPGAGTLCDGTALRVELVLLCWSGRSSTASASPTRRLLFLAPASV